MNDLRHTFWAVIPSWPLCNNDFFFVEVIFSNYLLFSLPFPSVSNNYIVKIKVKSFGNIAFRVLEAKCSELASVYKQPESSTSFQEDHIEFIESDFCEGNKKGPKCSLWEPVLENRRKQPAVWSLGTGV